MRLTREKMVTFARSLRMGEDGDNSAKSLSLLLRHQSAMFQFQIYKIYSRSLCKYSNIKSVVNKFFAYLFYD